MPKRYCCVQSCPNFVGTWGDIRFFLSPRDAELQKKWEQALNRPPSAKFRLCSLHFKEEDIITTRSGTTLKKGAIPIPVLVPKTESSPDTHMENVKIIDIATITNASSTPNLCQSCLGYDVKLQAAHAKITRLEEKVIKLTAENRKMRLYIRGQENLSEDKFDSRLKNVKTCSLCEVKLTADEFERHLCVERESIFCPLCPRTNAFQSTISFLDHVHQHTEASIGMDRRFLYRCNQCTLGYPMELLLECHKRSHITQKPMSMNVKTEPAEAMSIDETTNNDQSSSVSGPSNSVHAKLFKCGLCDMAFGLPKELQHHVRKSHKKAMEKRIECYLCKTEFETIEVLRVHMKRHERDHPCSICKMDLTPSELGSHLCGDEKIVTCEYCPNEFTATLKLVEHIEMSHRNEKFPLKFYRCDHCSKFYPSIVLKKLHLKSHEQDAPKRFVCKICKKAFSSKYSLQTHRKSHDEMRSHLCEECGKSFKTVRGLSFHRNSYLHSKEPAMIQCPDCPRTFNQLHNFKNHSAVHREDRYVCEICQAELVSKVSYKSHLKIHRRTEADRKYACKICPRKFWDPKTLRNHRSVHNGARLHSCRFCSQSYKYAGDLNKHLRTHLGNEIYECSKCPKRFKYPKELQKHEFQHYKEEKEAEGTNSPKDPDLRAKWDQAINRPPIGNFRLCSLHFKEEDIIWKSTGAALRSGAIPIPVPVPKTESASSTRNLCQSCFDYDVKLQAAYAKIALLEKEMSELRSRENKRMQAKRIVKNQIRSNSTQDTEKKMCSLCLCNQCNLAYAIKTLLDCHKKSHEDNPPPPEELNLKVEFQEPMSVDETSNDDTILPTSMLTVELNESVESARQLIQPSTQSSAVDEPPKPVSQDNKLFKCGLCDVAFELPKQLSCHVRENHDSKDSFQCYLCKFDFATVKQLWMHMKRHARDQKCDICKTELTLNELNSHLCGDGKSIRCDYCVDDFTITSKLVDHLEKSHKKRKIHRCEICSKVFWSIALKELHMLSHAQDAAVSTHEQDTAMPFACDICSKVFCKKFQLGRHMKTHDEQRPYLCEECGKGFKSAQNLLLHKTSIHYNEPTLQCPDCPRKFFRLCLLKSHSAVHRKDRDDKYVCEICQAELVSKFSGANIELGLDNSIFFIHIKIPFHVYAYYSTPKDPELRVKWAKIINVEPSINYRLCSLHFREEDIQINHDQGVVLKAGTVPTYVRQSQKPLENNVKIVEIETIKGVSIKPNSCQSCIDYDLKLQAAHTKITMLEEEVIKLTTENRKMKDFIREQENSTVDKIRLPLNYDEKCSLCQVKLTAVEFERHLCVEKESILCPLCPCTNAFQSTIGFLNHVDQHTEVALATDKRLLFKCNQCSVGYPMEILLECHKKSHVTHTTRTPEPKPIKFEPEESMSVDVTTDDDETLPPLSQSNSVSGPSKPVLGNDKLFKCGFCDVSFELPIFLSLHIKENHTKRKTHVSRLPKAKSECHEAKTIFVFRLREENENNTEKQKEKKIFQCYLCRTDFSTFKRLQVHMNRSHKRNHKCGICRMVLTAKELRSHLCGGEKCIRCEYCSNEFTTTKKLLDHLDKSHEKKKLHQCDKCLKFFTMIILKEHHLKSHELDAPKTFICEICSKAFPSKECLKNHIRIHDKTKSHLCEECGRGFSCVQYLESHKKTHTQRNPKFQCPDCPKKFLELSNLRRHSNLHRDDKYVCEICQAELISMPSYRKHKKIHQRTEADRKYACKICDKKFFDPKHLKIHQRVHTGARLFNCRFCDQSYKYTGDLNKHLRTHLGNEIYECPKCPKRFQYPKELQKHEFEHYKEEKEANQTM
ncbi:zinc finger protein 208-like [Sitodiplosis mosellana]|uniref:zinc finger protein 208-like n=1 Tax=Sitodiplosis mosellana TaxID=263140 RepID=UPI002443B99C|nr:zinc finger protein 208-like [Sitodiplosis mosellana]